MKAYQIIELEEQKKILQQEIVNLSLSNDPDKKIKIDILTNNYNDIDEQIKELKNQDVSIKNYSPLVIVGVIAVFILLGKRK